MDLKFSNDEPLYSIGAAAKLLNVSVPTLRLYEKEGLIIPFKKESRQRLYSKSDLERIKCIRNAINEEKISIQGIKLIYSFIPCWDILKCSLNKRENCPAYELRTKPCWSINKTGRVCSGNSCRECETYKNFSKHEKIQESILRISKS